jgi:PKD repeat protein
VGIAAPAQAIADRTVAFYSMDEQSGATLLQDSSGNGHHGAIGADVTPGVLYEGATAQRFATHLPTSGAHPGHTDTVPAATDLNPGSGDFSIEVRIRTTYSFGNIMQKGQGATTGGYWKLENPGGIPRCLFRGADGSSRTGYSKIDISDGQWHTIRCNRTSTYVEMWIDGVRQSRLTGPTGTISNNWDLSIGGKVDCDGQTVTCDYFIGDIDYIRIEKGSGGANAAPVPVPTIECVGLVCSTSGAGSTDADGAIQRYQWNYGDGSSYDGASVPTALHTYASAGTYDVTLTVTDDRGSSVSAVKQVTVAPAAETITFVGQTTSNANASTHQVAVPAAVQPGDTLLLFFSQNSQAVRTGPTGVTGWTQVGTLAGGSAWTTVWSKTAEASDAGTPVQIALSSQSKVNMVIAAYRGVEEISAVASRTDPASSAVRVTPNAPVSDDGSWAVSYWLHGDGATTTMTPPAGVSVRSNGSQTGGGRVTGLLADSGAMVPLAPYGGLSATAAAASTTTTSWTLILSPAPDAPVNQPPVSSFTATCELLDCAFDGSASTDLEGPLVSYTWEFGDGATVTTTEPTTTHAYAADGTFTAKLTVTDGSSLTAFTTRSVTVASADPQPAAIEYVGGASLSRTSISQFVTVPATVQEGDVMLLFLGLASTAAITDPAGWQPLGTVDGGSLRTRAWYKVAGASDAGATVTVPLDASIKGNLMVSAYRGAQAAAPVFASAAVPGNTTVRTSPVAAVATDGSWAVSYWAHRDSAATVLTPDPSVQLRTTGTQTGGGRVTTALADSAAAIPAGSYGGIVATADAASQHGAAWTVVLAPK